MLHKPQLLTTSWNDSSLTSPMCIHDAHVNNFFFLLFVYIFLSVYFAFSATEYKRVEEFFPPLWSFLGPFDFSRDRFISILLPGCPLFSWLFFFFRNDHIFIKLSCARGGALCVSSGYEQMGKAFGRVTLPSDPLSLCAPFHSSNFF